VQKERSKYINAKRAVVGQNKRGEDYVKIALTPEEARNMVEDLTANLENPRGVNVIITTTMKEGQNGQFLSGYAIVDGIQDPATFNRGGGSQTRFNRVGQSSETKDKVAAFKSKNSK
jgi:hypothetical protein